jgi:hypothetical protein
VPDHVAGSFIDGKNHRMTLLRLDTCLLAKLVSDTAN